MVRLINRTKHLCCYGTQVFFILVLLGAWALPAYAQENLWKELNDKTTSLLQKKRYADAIKAGEEALQVAKDTFPSGNTRIADSMNLLGILYRTYGRYAEAEPLFQQALTIYGSSPN
ncbi:MAG: tetratricopeptide repeat protein [Planctomycetia bacterium]|nr:tetratricopeptide repeat protein [Planctomycetia bacterium]